MPRYSIAEAQGRLAAIVEEALAGEKVTLTRDGAPIIELRPAVAPTADASLSRLIDDIGALSRSLPPIGGDVAKMVRHFRDDPP